MSLSIEMPRRDARLPKERIADQVMLLYNIDNLPPRSYPGNIMLTKLSFLSELKCQIKKLNAPHYGFFRYIHGPMTRQLYYDLADLKQYGLIRANNRIKKDGIFAMKLIDSFFDEHKNFFRIVDKTLDDYGKLNVEEIKNHVYELEVTIGSQVYTIRDLPMHTQILNPLTIKNVNNFTVSKEWEDDVLDVLRPEIRHQLHINYIESKPLIST